MVYEIWFKFQFWSSISAAAIYIVAILALLTESLTRSLQWKRKIRLLEKHGFVKFLEGVPALGDGAFYAWSNEELNMVISEREIKVCGYADLKKILCNKR